MGASTVRKHGVAPPTISGAEMDVKTLYLTKDFMKSEFRCRCKRGKDCDAKPMDAGFMHRLQALRDEWGRPLIPTSGARCSWHNERIGGAAGSQHLVGKAADFAFRTPTEVAAFAQLAEKHGFGGIGRGQRLVHVDDGPPHRRWTYTDK